MVESKCGGEGAVRDLLRRMIGQGTYFGVALQYVRVTHVGGPQCAKGGNLLRHCFTSRDMRPCFSHAGSFSLCRHYNL